MAIAFDSSTNSGAKTNVSSFSWNHVCTGNNLLLVVGINSYTALANDRTVSSVTYNGVLMTQIDTIRNDFTGNRATLFYLINPSTGSNTISVTMADTTENVLGGAISYTGVKQSGQPDAYNTGKGNSTPASVSVTTNADNCWVVSTISSGGTTIAGGQTERWNVVLATGRGGGSDTNGPKTPAGSQEMTWTITGGAQYWAEVVASFAPIPPPIQTERDMELSGSKTIILDATQVENKIRLNWTYT